MPSVAPRMCLDWESSSSSFFQKKSKVSEVLWIKAHIFPHSLAIPVLCYNNYPSFTCLTSHLVAWVGGNHQSHVFTAVAFNRHKTVLSFVSKESADEESSCFRMSLPWLLPFDMFCCNGKRYAVSLNHLQMQNLWASPSTLQWFISYSGSSWRNPEELL